MVTPGVAPIVMNKTPKKGSWLSFRSLRSTFVVHSPSFWRFELTSRSGREGMSGQNSSFWTIWGDSGLASAAGLGGRGGGRRLSPRWLVVIWSLGRPLELWAPRPGKPRALPLPFDKRSGGFRSRFILETHIWEGVRVPTSGTIQCPHCPHSLTHDGQLMAAMP